MQRFGIAMPGEAEGEFCVLGGGGLANHAGIPLPTIHNKAAILNPALHSFAQALCKRYGFTEDELASLQMCNDSYHYMELFARRAALKEKVIHFWKR